LLLFGLLILLPALACGPTALLGGEEEATPVPPEEPQPDVSPPEDLCGDGVCDEVEQASPGLCPQDCEEVPPPPPQFDLTGTWNSPEWGLMELTQTGDRVVGTYVYRDGQIEGRLEGNRFSYRWWETAPGQPYESVTDPGLRGDGYFDISADGSHIEGEWRYADSELWVGAWTADRQ
jgi:hypothetical protein